MRLQGADDSVSRLSRPRYLIKYPTSTLMQYLEKSCPSLLHEMFPTQAQIRDNHAFFINFYNFGHDRFGKRNDGTDQKQSDMEDFMRLLGADDSVSRLSRPRYLNKYPTPNIDTFRKTVAPTSCMICQAQKRDYQTFIYPTPISKNGCTSLLHETFARHTKKTIIRHIN